MTAPLLSNSQMRAIQKLGETSMQATVVIRHKVTPAAKDASAPFGDDEVTYESVTTTVKGWIRPIVGSNYDMGVGMLTALGEFWLRVPVGTQLDPNDEVTVDGIFYVVVDDNVEQTWPEWTIARLRRIQ